jgi:ElaB/YqjD/DUF883 family membrane-anchored ribosome-binding protein
MAGERKAGEGCAMSTPLHDLGQDAGKLAREHIIDPARDLIQDARTNLQNTTHQVRSHLKADAHQARESLGQLHRQTSHWIAANPFTAVGLALLTGAAMAAATRSARV